MSRINFQRFLDLMAQQAEIGSTPEGGLNRPALSEMDIRARQWLFERATAAGLEVAMDGAGNQRVMLRASDPDAQTLLIGSHLDSVPNGGRFDGALGVVAGLEVLLTLKDSGAELPFHVEVVNFTDEEGTLRGLLGSSAMTGTLIAENLPNVRGGADELQEGLSRLGLSSGSIGARTRSAWSLEQDQPRRHRSLAGAHLAWMRPGQVADEHLGIAGTSTSLPTIPSACRSRAKRGRTS